MKTYTVLFLLSAGISLLLTPLLLWLCRRFQWMDLPDGGRKIHARPIPRIGGVAIFLAFGLALSTSALWHNLIFDAFRWQWQDVLFLLLPGTAILLIGLYDDLRGLPARVKFVLQWAAAGLLYYNGFRIEQIANPFGGAPWSLGWLSMPMTAFWIVAVTNAFNLIDGMDGLAAGIAFFVSIASFFVSLAQFNPMVSVLSIALAGATLGFLRFNFNPARIFMGDCGSYFLGFVLGALAIKGSQKSSMVVSIAVPILLLGLPILDTTLAIVRRFLEGKPLFTADQQHIHHRLLRLARSQRFTVIILYGATAFLGLMSWLLVVTQSRLVALTSLMVGLAAFWGVRSLGYEEFQELGAYLAKLSLQRRALATQIYLRKISDRLAAASRLADALAIAEEAFQHLNFDGAEIRLTASQLPAVRSVYSSVVRDYRWSWNPAGGPEPSQVPLLWELNVPLTGEHGHIGYLRLARALEKNSLPSQLASIIQTFATKLSAAIASVPEAELAGLFEIVAAPREGLRRVEAGIGRV